MAPHRAAEITVSRSTKKGNANTRQSLEIDEKKNLKRGFVFVFILARAASPIPFFDISFGPLVFLHLLVIPPDACLPLLAPVCNTPRHRRRDRLPDRNILPGNEPGSQRIPGSAGQSGAAGRPRGRRYPRQRLATFHFIWLGTALVSQLDDVRSRAPPRSLEKPVWRRVAARGGAR